MNFLSIVTHFLIASYTAIISTSLSESSTLLHRFHMNSLFFKRLKRCRVLERAGLSTGTKILTLTVFNSTGISRQNIRTFRHDKSNRKQKGAVGGDNDQESTTRAADIVRRFKKSHLFPFSSYVRKYLRIFYIPTLIISKLQHASMIILSGGRIFLQHAKGC